MPSTPAPNAAIPYGWADGEPYGAELSAALLLIDSLIPYKSKNVRGFGATGDGVTDDTAAIQAAIDSIAPPLANVEPGGDATYVLLPPGLYKTSDTIKIPTGIHLIGMGKRSTTIKCTNANKDVLLIQGQRVTISSMAIYGPGTAGTGRGIGCAGQSRTYSGSYSASNVYVPGIYINDCLIVDTGSWSVEMVPSSGNEIFFTVIENCEMFNARSGGSIHFGGGSNPALYVKRCNIDGLGQWQVGGSGTLTTKTTYNATGGVGVDRGAIHLETVLNAVIESCAIEVIDMPCISVLSGDSVIIRDCNLFQFNQFSAGAETSTNSGRYMVTTSGNINGMVISGCHFRSDSPGTAGSGPRFFKSDNDAGAGNWYIGSLAIKDCYFESYEATTRITAHEDVVLGQGSDRVVVTNCRLLAPIAAILRALVINWSSDSSLRARVGSGSEFIGNGGFAKPHLMIGTNHVWRDVATGRLRESDFIDGEPTADSQGRTIHSTGGVGTLTNNSATPSVAASDTFLVSNTSPTTITNLTGAYSGQTVTLIFTTANTTIADSGNFKLSAGLATAPTNLVLILKYDGSAWWEMGRTQT